MKSFEIDFVKKMISLLDERSKRIFLGAYSKCLGYGSISELSNITGISRTTITEGKKEAEALDMYTDNRTVKSGFRSPGAGRKSYTQIHPDIRDKLIDFFNGDENEDPICWTTKSLRDLETDLSNINLKISYPTVGALLEEYGFTIQKTKKYNTSAGVYSDRYKQFTIINDMAKQFIREGNPVIHVSIRKKSIKGYNIQKSSDDIKNQKSESAPELNTGLYAASIVRNWWFGSGISKYNGTHKMMIITDSQLSDERYNSKWISDINSFEYEAGLTIYMCTLPTGTYKWNSIKERFKNVMSVQHIDGETEITEIEILLISSP